MLSFTAIVLKSWMGKGPVIVKKGKLSVGLVVFVFVLFFPSLRVRIKEVSVRELKKQFGRPGQGGSVG